VTELLAASGDRVHDLLQEPRESLDGCGLEESFRLQYAEDVAAEDATWQVKSPSCFRETIEVFVSPQTNTKSVLERHSEASWPEYDL
jgi:hypothetical protein